MRKMQSFSVKFHAAVAGLFFSGPDIFASASSR